MLKALCFTSALLLSMPAISPAQFEGTIGMKVTVADDDSSREMTYLMFVRQDMLMTEVSGVEGGEGTGKFIFRGDRQLLWIVNDREKSYLEISLKDSSRPGVRRTGPDSAAPAAAPLLRKTGRSESILGYPCDEYVVDEGGRTSHIWGTVKLGGIYDGLQKSFGTMGAEGLSGGRGWEDELAASKIFPLKIVTMREGKPEETQEVVSIDPKDVGLSTFEPPKEYTRQSLEFDMNKLIQSMQESMNDGRFGGQDTSGGKQ